MIVGEPFKVKLGDGEFESIIEMVNKDKFRCTATLKTGKGRIISEEFTLTRNEWRKGPNFMMEKMIDTMERLAVRLLSTEH